jgi:hypothetical protein
MTHQEKRAWIMAVVAVLAYTAYVVIIVSGANGQPLSDVPYATALLWTVGVAIAANIVIDIGIDIATPKASRDKDIRDHEIGRFGDAMGQSFVVIGAVAALLMALVEWDWFWIANVIYLCFVLSAVVGSVSKIIAYRGGLPQW